MAASELQQHVEKPIALPAVEKSPVHGKCEESQASKRQIAYKTVNWRKNRSTQTTGKRVDIFAVPGSLDTKKTKTRPGNKRRTGGWTMGIFEEDCSKLWEDWYKELFTVDTVVDFWKKFHELKPPSKLEVGCDYSFFRCGKSPNWEDEKNKKGGRWVATVSKSLGPKLDKMWLDLLMLLIGNAIRCKEVSGATLHIGAEKNQVSVWTAHSDYTWAVIHVGKQMRKFLHLQQSTLMYLPHKTMISQHSNVYPLHVM